MRRAFDIYASLAPLLLLPLAVVLWWRHYDGNVALVAIALSVPILHAYIVPGIGTNVLGMWAFNARLKIGNFRPQHGFLFGSATALLVLPVIGTPDADSSPVDVLVAAGAGGLVLLAVNWIYDALALKHGVLEVYNQPWARGAGPWSIAGDYVWWFFGLFGFLYVGGLKLAERMLISAPSARNAFLVGTGMLIATLFLPTLGYVASSWLRHGHSGCRPVSRRRGEGECHE